MRIFGVSPFKKSSTAGTMLEIEGLPRTKHKSTGAGSSLRNRNFVMASRVSKIGGFSFNDAGIGTRFVSIEWYA
jgi:hypothetical protein